MKMALPIAAIASFFGTKQFIKHRNKSKKINSGDLNNYIFRGDFFVSGNISNAPTQSGFLKVEIFGENDEYVIQQYFDFENPRVLLVRRKTNEIKWSQWGSVATSSELPLLGKKIVCLGDSITGSFDWPQKLQKIVGGNVSNLGISGTTAAMVQGDFGALSLCKIAESVYSGDWVALNDAAKRILDSELKQDYVDTINNLSKTDWMSVDYIVISFGTNDYGKNVPIGQDEDVSQTTFKGALNYSLEKIITKNPKIQIITTSPLWRIKGINGRDTQDADSAINNENKKLVDYADAVINISHLNKTPCIDLYRNSGINRFNYNYFFIDGLHPSEAGTTRIAEKISSYLVL